MVRGRTGIKKDARLSVLFLVKKNCVDRFKRAYFHSHTDSRARRLRI